MWDSYENKDGTITLCCLEFDEKWGNWGEIVLTPQEMELFKVNDKDIMDKIWSGLK